MPDGMPRLVSEFEIIPDADECAVLVKLHDAVSIGVGDEHMQVIVHGNEWLVIQ